VGRQAVDDRPTGITETEQLGHFVEGFAGGIVARFAQEAIAETFADLEQVSMPAAHHQRQGGQFGPGGLRLAAPGFENDRVDVAFQVVDCDQRKTAREAQRLGIGQAHQKRSHQSRAVSGGYGR
jgi:hypothetical protein